MKFPQILISHWFFPINFKNILRRSQLKNNLFFFFYASPCLVYVFCLLSLSAVSVNSIYVKRKKENHLVAIFIYILWSLRFTIVSLSRDAHNDGFMQIVILRNEKNRDTGRNYLESVIFLPAVLSQYRRLRHFPLTKSPFLIFHAERWN